MLPNWFVCVIGMSIVFLGLLGLVLICQLLGTLVAASPKKETAVPAAPAAPAAQTAEIPNKQEFIAAVSAAIAEEMGEDVSAIRITSVRRI